MFFECHSPKAEMVAAGYTMEPVDVGKCSRVGLKEEVGVEVTAMVGGFGDRAKAFVASVVVRAGENTTIRRHLRGWAKIKRCEISDWWWGPLDTGGGFVPQLVDPGNDGTTNRGVGDCN